MLSGKSFIDIFNHLTGFLKEKDNQAMDQEMYPEAITGLSLEVLKKFISNKDLCKKLRVYSYETLSCLDSITSCKLESYFGFVERLLQSPIAKDYAKYASKIMNLITKRIEIEYIACSRAGLKTNIYIDRCLSLVSTVLSIKDVLEEQFEGIESELAKIFLFMSCKDVDFASEIISIAGTIVRVAGCHLSIMTPVVQSFDRLYILCNYELTDLYQVFYNYILKDSNFVLHEGRSAARTTLGGWVEEERNQIASSSSIDLEKTPFRCINKVLFQVIRGAYSEPSKQHITTVQKALMLIIMEFQIWNEAGLLSNYRDILAELYCLVESLENTFEKARESTTEEVYVLYIWTSLALLNAFHYYYEEVSQEMLKTGFLIRFINKGAELISSVYIELPVVLKKLYQLSLIRLLSSSAELELNIHSIACIVNLITAILGEEIPTEEQEMQEFLGNKKKRVNSKKIKKAGKLNKDQENGTNFKAIKDGGFEERLTSGASLVPNHEPKDFYIMGVNLFGYFQHTYQKLKESNDQFTQALRSLLAPDQLSVLNDVLSATVLNISTNLVSVNPKSHLMKEEINHQNTVRKIAKVVRRPGQDSQTQNKTMIAQNGN